MYCIMYSKQMHFLTSDHEKCLMQYIIELHMHCVLYFDFLIFKTLLITNRAQVITFNVYVLIATAALSQVIRLVISGPLFFAR